MRGPAEVLAAVKASGLALEYAAEALRGEKEFASWRGWFVPGQNFFLR